MIAPGLLSRAWYVAALRDSWRGIRELRRFRTLDADARRRSLATRLQSLVRDIAARADALPEWREAARIVDADALLEAWPTLPIVTKSMLRESFTADRVAATCGRPGRISASGGSTGEPTRFFHDRAMLSTSEAKAYYVRRRLGWSPGMATIAVWGSDRDIGRRDPIVKRIVGSLRRDVIIGGYRFDEGTARRFVDEVNTHAPVAVYGFTSMLVHVARVALELGLRIRPNAIRVAWNGGEVLTADQSELFDRAFGVPIHNLYGGRELSTIACQFALPGPLEVLGPFDYVEIVDDAGAPAAPGQPGRLIVTSTVCRGTPFLRYEIGDMAIADAEHRDASGIVALREILGRRSGLLQLANGTQVNNLYWNHLFKEFNEVQQFQVVVHADGSLTFRLRGRGFQGSAEADLRKKLLLLLGAVPVRFEWVPTIPLTRLGKLLQVVDERMPAGVATERPR
jgi:phenylacetate-CoA ligase